VEDAGGNTVTTFATGVTMAIATGTGTLACTTNPVTPSSGVATFAGCSLDKATTYTLKATSGALNSTTNPPITISAGTATQLVFTTAPSSSGTSGTAWAQQPAVTVEDAAGNTVTTFATGVTLAINTGTGTLTCTTNPVTPSSGVAAFAGCALDKPATYTLKVTATGIGDSTTHPSISISVGTATQLVFTTQPGGGTAGTAWATQPAVTLEDAGGNVVTSTAQSVTLAIQNNPGGGTLSGTATAAVNTSTGVATFSGLSINKAGNGYTLTATGNTVNTTAGVVVSSGFNIAMATPSFSNLTASQTIAQGAASINLSGTIAAGSVAPPSSETVTITINGSNTPATIGSSGNFGPTTVNTSSLSPNVYTITYSYAGDSNFNSATDTSTTLTVTYPTLVTFRSFGATPQDGGVLLEWQTGREVSNLGFHLYRDGVRLTRSPVAGSALLAGPSTVLTAGNSYSWFDPDGTSSSSYTLEDLDLNGTKSLHGPFYVDGPSASTSGAKRPPARAGRISPLLNQLGRAGTANDRSLTTTTFDPEKGLATAFPASQGPVLATPQQGVPVSQQYALAAGQAVKFGVQHEGWYRVDASQLTAAGMPAGINPDNLRLFVEGQEQAMIVQGSAVQGTAVQGSGQVSAIEFYGTGLDTIFSDTRVYWLVWGANSGLRVQSSGGKAAGNAPASFPAAVQWRPRSLYFPALLNGDADNFFGPVLDSTDPVTQPLTVTHLNAATPGSSTLQVTMQGVNLGLHAVVVQLNGSQLGSMSFNGQANSVSTFTFSNSLLHAGANTVSLTTISPGDVTLVDTVLLSYPHSYTADGDYLRLTAASGSTVTIGGFSNNQIQVMDITDPSDVASLSGTIANQGTGFAVSFALSGQGPRTLLAFTNAQKSQPVSITANRPSSWHTSQAGADMVMIGHASFISSLGPLQKLRQVQGHTVTVLDVQDAYDEFNFGEQSPYAIKALLSTANSAWTTKPHWVLLVGDATYDPRNYMGTGQVDYLPVELIGTTQLETSSDDWFVAFNGDGIPQMAIGRLPVDTAVAASALVAKIVAYDQAGAAAWKNRALLVSGANDSADPFESYTSAVQALLPQSLTITKILQGSDPNAAADFLAAFNSGRGLVNFAGHGSTEVWDGGLFSSTAAGTVTNGSATPFVISMTCLNGYFQDVFTFSLAKALLQSSGGGAVGVWASSSLTDSGPQATLNQSMIGALFGHASMTIGDAAVAAKKTVTDPDVRKSWMLFGDPAMKLR